MGYLRKIMLAAAIFCSGSTVSAGTINLADEGYQLGSTTLSQSGLAFDLSDPFGFGQELVVSGPSGPVVSSFFPTDATQYALNFVDALGTAEDGLVGASELAAMDGTISLLFEGITLTGDLVGTGSGAVLVTITDTAIDVDESQTSMLAFFDGLSADGATVSVQTLDALAAIPLPASLPLVLAGLGSFALIKRRKARKKAA